MIGNYLKVAWRMLRKYPVYGVVNVLGLAVAIGTCLVIGLYVQDELSYDTFHPEAHRTLSLLIEAGGADGFQQYVTPGFASILRNEIPGVKDVTQIDPAWESGLEPTSGVEEADSSAVDVIRADSSFFDVFPGFPIRRAERADVLNEPGEAVLSVSTAKSLFGSQSPIGRVFEADIDAPFADSGDSPERYTVVGLTEVPDQSTLQFGAVVRPPSSAVSEDPWNSTSERVYVRRDREAEPARLAKRLQDALPDKGFAGAVEDVRLLPLPDLYLSEAYDTGGFNGQSRYLYLFASVGLLVLLIAGFNYVNLAVSQVDRRAGEVGLRRAMGAQRRQVVGQFLAETALVAVAAFIGGLVLASALLPLFNNLFGKNLALAPTQSGWVLGAGFLATLALSLVAGAYPALMLSRSQPARTLREASKTVVGDRGWLQKGLVVAQFAISAGLIFSTIVIYQQLDYVQTKGLGFDEEQVVSVSLGDLGSQRRENLQQAVQEHPAVQKAVIGSAVPGEVSFRVRQQPQDLSDSTRTESREKGNRKISMVPIEADTGYVETLGFEMAAGNLFSEVPPDRRRQGYLLNEEMASVLGWTPESAVGKPFSVFGNQGEVIGVVENFHITGFRKPIEPVMLSLSMNWPGGNALGSSMLAARLSPEEIGNGLDHLRSVVQRMNPGPDFEYAFLNDRFDQMYRSERRLGRIFLGFALVAIVIASMGLFGLAAYSVQRRIQELGLRKALGATGRSILGLLARKYGTLMAIAFLAMAPLAYWGIHWWLREFAYRTDVGLWPFVLTASLVALIAAASIGYHAARAIRTEPARVLRSE